MHGERQRQLLKELNIYLPTDAITIDCDNTQTIGLVTKEIAKLQTKLRHVDIHNPLATTRSFKRHYQREIRAFG